MKAISRKDCPAKVSDQWTIFPRGIQNKGMVFTVFVFLICAITASCAPIVRTEGRSGPVSWEATDLRLEKKVIQGTKPVEMYYFTLVPREMQGRAPLSITLKCV